MDLPKDFASSFDIENTCLYFVCLSRCNETCSALQQHGTRERDFLFDFFPLNFGFTLTWLLQ